MVTELDYFKVQSIYLIFYAQNCVSETKFPFLSRAKSNVSEPIFQMSDITQVVEKEGKRRIYSKSFIFSPTFWDMYQSRMYQFKCILKFQHRSIISILLLT